jgi:hypothetical protein
MVRRSRAGRFLRHRRPLAAVSSLMAGRCGRNGAGQILLRRRREDQISALPDFVSLRRWRVACREESELSFIYAVL